MNSTINKQNLRVEEKQAQSDSIEFMALYRILTGLEPKLGQIVCGYYPFDIVTTISRIKRE